MALLSETVAVKLEPTIISYGTVNSVGEKNWPRPAVALLSEMVAVRLEPNIISYGTVNSAREESWPRQS